MQTTILIALGSNRRHGRHGPPARVVAAAIEALAAAGLEVVRVSPILATAPLGPGSRHYANAVAAVASDLALPAVLALLQRIERHFGRRRGRRWGDRVLDLDILGAGAAVWRQGTLEVPHPRLAERRFVLDPLVTVAPGWRHPQLHLTVRQLRARALRPNAASVASRRKGP